MTRPEQHPATNLSPVADGARAAGLLREACQSALGAQGSLHLEVVRDAALDLERHLEVLADSGEEDSIPVELLAEGALRCADTANLAACAVPELPPGSVPAAISATRLAVEAIRSLHSLIEAAADGSEGERAEYALRDARATMWRSDLVIRQIEEAPPESR